MDIVLKNVSKIIKDMVVLNDISLKMSSGRIYGFQGVNGSGKTMLMRAISGLVRIDEGDITINDKKLGKDMEFPDSIGLLIEKPGLIEGYTAMQNLKILADVRKKTTEEELKNLLIRLNLNPDDKRKVKKYSLGMKQKLGIAQAFIDNPDILILDEPFNALDEKSVNILKDMLNEYINEERLIIISCHGSEIISEMCDEIFEMEEGRIIEK